MNENEKKRIIIFPFILLLAAGIAWAGSQGGASVLGLPIFAICVIIAFAIQWIAFIPAYKNKTEKYYDLTGSLTYISLTVLAVLLSPEIDTRSLVLMVIVLIWALRLGTFLFRRIRAEGEDRRFREIKQSGIRFFTAWTIQGLWVVFTLSAALVAITTEVRRDFGVIAIIGLIIWVIGFGFEALADWQKSRFRSKEENKDKFINTGLWSWSRHPNYFGEILLWIGVAIIAIPVLRGWQWVTMISPVFVIFLLTKVSGVPLLEKRADEKWGGQENYEKYKENTPVLVPKPF